MNKKGKVISFINMKGGVGKTTLSRELAYLLSINKYKVLYIDIDPQSNSTQSFFEKFSIQTIDKDGKRRKDIQSINHLYLPSFTDVKKEQILIELTDFLHLIPGDLTTVFMDRDSNSKNEQRLLKLITDWELKKQYHFIFIDCPPTYSFYTVSAFMASDYYLIPARPDLYSILGLDLLNDVVEHFITEDQSAIMQNRSLKCLGIVLTMIENNGGEYDIIRGIESLAYSNGLYLFKSRFRYFPKLVSSKLEKFHIDREDASINDFFKQFYQEFLERIENEDGK